MGLSGSGKSTLIRQFNRLIDPTEGSLRIDGIDVLKLTKDELVEFRRYKISMVFQGFGLFPHRNALQNVGFGLNMQNKSKNECEETARHWLEVVGLNDYEQQFPAQLSGGQQQRVGLARALSANTEILLMDEPFSALDPLIRSGMQEQLIALQANLKKTIIFITHDLDEALRLGDRIAILKDGMLSQIGRPANILLKPANCYVEAFVQDVNRARILSVDALMQPPENQLTSQDIKYTLHQIKNWKGNHGYVFNKNNYQGVVTKSIIRKVANGLNNQRLDEVCIPGPSLLPDTILQDALPVVINSKFPIPIITKEGKFCGTISKTDIMDSLAKTNKKLR